LQERYENDHLTHLKLDTDLWLKGGSFGESNRNQVYGTRTIQSRICEHSIMYWLLVPRNQVWTPNLWLSKQLYENKLKLKWLDLVLRWPNLGPRQPNLGYCIRSCCQTSMVHVVYLVAHLVLMKIRLFLLLLLQLLSSR
jgi:hypothetical protein